MRRNLLEIKDELLASYLPENQRDETMRQMIQEARVEIFKIATPRVVYQEVEIINGQLENCCVPILGNDIQKHLQDAQRCLLVAGTLGSGIDQWIKTSQLQDMGKAYVCDMCANAAIEQVLDDFQSELQELDAYQAYYFTDRFAPGYGDYPLEVQPLLLKQLDATRQIGLHITSSNLMIPCKSITGLIGLCDTPQPSHIKGCACCALKETCSRRKEGSFCGRK